MDICSTLVEWALVLVCSYLTCQLMGQLNGAGAPSWGHSVYMSKWIAKGKFTLVHQGFQMPGPSLWLLQLQHLGLQMDLYPYTAFWCLQMVTVTFLHLYSCPTDSSLTLVWFHILRLFSFISSPTPTGLPDLLVYCLLKNEHLQTPNRKEVYKPKEDSVKPSSLSFLVSHKSIGDSQAAVPLTSPTPVNFFPSHTETEGMLIGISWDGLVTLSFPPRGSSNRTHCIT